MSNKVIEYKLEELNKKLDSFEQLAKTQSAALNSLQIHNAMLAEHMKNYDKRLEDTEKKITSFEMSIWGAILSGVISIGIMVINFFMKK